MFLLAFTCGNGSESNIVTDLEADKREGMEAAGLKAEDFKGNIYTLLTLEMAAKVSGLPESDAEIKHSKALSLESIKYEWQSDRTRHVEISKGNPFEVPRPNIIEMSWVKNTTLKQFKHDYHNPTPEELKRAEEVMNQKLKDLESDGKTDKESSDLASNIATNSISKFNVNEVANVGDYAVFVNSGILGVTTRDLKVFYNGLSFTLEVDLSDDSSYNDKKAIELAKIIVQQKLK